MSSSIQLESKLLPCFYLACFARQYETEIFFFSSIHFFHVNIKNGLRSHKRYAPLPDAIYLGHPDVRLNLNYTRVIKTIKKIIIWNQVVFKTTRHTTLSLHLEPGLVMIQKSDIYFGETTIKCFFFFCSNWTTLCTMSLRFKENIRKKTSSSSSSSFFFLIRFITHIFYQFALLCMYPRG